MPSKDEAAIKLACGVFFKNELFMCEGQSIVSDAIPRMN